MYERILVPLDGSKLAEQVFPHVAELARVFDSEVILIGVCEPEEREYGQACQLYMDSEADNLRSVMGGSAVKVTTTFVIGKPAKHILGYAEENNVNLIAMTSHGRSGIMPWSLGSTVNRVLHKVGVPLLIVRAKEVSIEADKAGLFGRILVPLDGSERSAAVLPYVAEITKKLKSEIILFQVVEAGKHVHTIGGLDYVPFRDQHVDSAKARTREYLEEESAKLGDTKAIVRCEVRTGKAAKEILKFAGEVECSLTAMASHGHSGIETWLHGSVTYKILQASDKSVLLVPSPEIHG